MTDIAQLRKEISAIDEFAAEQKADLLAKLYEAEAAEAARLAAIAEAEKAERLLQARDLAAEVVAAAKLVDEHLAAAADAMRKLKALEAQVRRAAPHAVAWGNQFMHRRIYTGALNVAGVGEHADVMNVRGTGETLHAVTSRFLNRLLERAS